MSGDHGWWLSESSDENASTRLDEDQENRRLSRESRRPGCVDRPLQSMGIRQDKEVRRCCFQASLRGSHEGLELRRGMILRSCTRSMHAEGLWSLRW